MAPKLVICNHCEAINRVHLDKVKDGKFYCGKCSQEIDLRPRLFHVVAKKLDKIINASSLPVIVDVYANWCGPCKVYGPIFEEMAMRLWEEAEFFKIDSDKNPNFSARFNIRGIPATLVFKDGKLIKSQSGLLNHDQLEILIKMAN